VIEIAGDEAAAYIESSPPAPSDRRVLCHTDVKGEHVFVDEHGAAVRAIIDWADTEVCDPARDYAGIIDWLGPSFGRAVIDASGEPDPTLFERALWLSRAGMFEWMHDSQIGVEDAPESLLRQQIQTAFGAVAPQ
jgi:aminoglycoside phosphotransferase (APT) family kinase protein